MLKPLIIVSTLALEPWGTVCAAQSVAKLIDDAAVLARKYKSDAEALAIQLDKERTKVVALEARLTGVLNEQQGLKAKLERRTADYMFTQRLLDDKRVEVERFKADVNAVKTAAQVIRIPQAIYIDAGLGQRVQELETLRASLMAELAESNKTIETLRKQLAAKNAPTIIPEAKARATTKRMRKDSHSRFPLSFGMFLEAGTLFDPNTGRSGFSALGNLGGFTGKRGMVYIGAGAGYDNYEQDYKLQVISYVGTIKFAVLPPGFKNREEHRGHKRYFVTPYVSVDAGVAELQRTLPDSVVVKPGPMLNLGGGAIANVGPVTRVFASCSYKNQMLEYGSVTTGDKSVKNIGSVVLRLGVTIIL